MHQQLGAGVISRHVPAYPMKKGSAECRVASATGTHFVVDHDAQMCLKARLDSGQISEKGSKLCLTIGTYCQETEDNILDGEDDHLVSDPMRCGRILGQCNLIGSQHKIGSSSWRRTKSRVVFSMTGLSLACRLCTPKTVRACIKSALDRRVS